MEDFIFNHLSSLISVVLTTVVIGYGRSIRSTMKRSRERETDQSTALMALLRAKIRTYFTAAHQEGYISSRDFTDVEALHAIYKKLGGNGEGDRMRDELKGKIRYER